MFVKHHDMRGFLLVDKGKGLTSFDVVFKIRKWGGATQLLRVGHAGTLDPLATGLLIVAVGEATKVLEYLIGFDKEYEVKAHFGAVSDTFDAEGKITYLDVKQVEKFKMTKKSFEQLILPKFLGVIDQVPPKFSALKIKGRRAMDMARDGEKFEMKSRKVNIYDLIIKKFEWPEVVLRVKCGSGTYIRSLVHDIGQVVGCGAYVKELRRMSIDGFDLSDAMVVDKDFSFVNKNIEQYLIPIEKMFEHWPKIELSDGEYRGLKDGGSILYKKSDHGAIYLAYYKGKIVGLIEKSVQFPGYINFRKQIFD